MGARVSRRASASTLFTPVLNGLKKMSQGLSVQECQQGSASDATNVKQRVSARYKKIINLRS
jgi:hypothetical protein